jgi:hypothetical protein
MSTYIKSGWGFTVGQNFDRAIVDIPIDLAPSEYAKPGHVAGYIKGDPDSRVAFLRGNRIRVQVVKRGLGGQL